MIWCRDDPSGSLNYQVYYTKDGEIHHDLPSLPAKIERHCLAIIDDEKMASVGGRPNGKTVSTRMSGE